MIEFFNRLFGRQTSGATAKERLRLVLMSDHLSLAPEMIDAMKRDLVDVISRYVEVDRDRIDVHFEHQDKALAMLANIPITGVSRNGTNGANGTNGTNVHYSNGLAASHGEESNHPEEPKGPLIEATANHAESANWHAEPLEAPPSAAEEPTRHGQASVSHPQVSKDPEESKGDVVEASAAQPKPKPVTAKNAARPRRKRRKAQQ